ncbi:MAG TPA: TonB-dependent receptor [Gemmatimonadaceae bacterium]|nr:TonB-dependent receptor [Gemmatimonadaceae bacterium]
MPLYPGCQGKAVNTLLTQNPLIQLPGGVRDGAVRSFAAHVRGGGDRYSYYVSADHNYEEGVLGNNYDRRRSLRSNFSFAPTEKVNLAVNAGIVDEHLRLPLDGESAQGLLFSALRATPGRFSTLPGQTQQGWFTVTPDQSNQYDNETSTQRMILGATATYQPFQWFHNRLTAGLDWTNGLATLFAPPNTPVLTGDTLGLTAQRVPRSTLYTLDYNGTLDYSVMPSLVSSTSFGSQVIANQSQVLVGTGRGLGSPDVTLIGSTTTISASNSFSQNNSVGYYVQEQLGWKNRLFGTVALRADDNSSFGSNFNAAYYPKASLSWILSEEPVLKSVFQTLHADNFKFRTAWGEAGRAPEPYSATRTYTISVATMGSGTVSALRTSAFGNPNLKPERGRELEVGFETDLFSGRAGADFTYYNKRMNDVLVSTAVAPSTGFRGSQQANIGSTSNSGIELGLTYSPVQLKNFGWDGRLSLSTNHNKLLSFGDPSINEIVPFASYGSVQQFRVGYPLGGFWGQVPKRNPDGSLVLVKGAIVWDSTVGPAFDPANKFIGPSTPTRQISLANTFTFFRNLSLYTLFDHQGGFYNYRGVDIYRCASSQNCRQLNDPNFPASELPIYQAGVSNAPHAVYIHKADFVKLRDVSITYTLPASLAARTAASAASITLAGHNLALWSSYPGPDPEVNTYGYQNAITGSFNRGDIYAMPMTRRLTASLSLTF